MRVLLGETKDQLAERALERRRVAIERAVKGGALAGSRQAVVEPHRERYFACQMSALTRITDHAYWMPPGPPDRPSLCSVVGKRRTLMLDAGSSAAHAKAFVEALRSAGGTRPSAVVYTHEDWDHVLGGAELGGIVIAHALTAERLIELGERDWSDEGLDRRVADGLSSARHVADVKAEMPSPRAVEVAPADIVFHDRIEIDLGGVTIRVRHIGGDHSADSCVMYVEPDGVLFMGDCTSASPEGVIPRSQRPACARWFSDRPRSTSSRDTTSRSPLAPTWRTCSRRCDSPSVPHTKAWKSKHRTRTSTTSSKPFEQG